MKHAFLKVKSLITLVLAHLLCTLNNGSLQYSVRSRDGSRRLKLTIESHPASERSDEQEDSTHGSVL